MSGNRIIFAGHERANGKGRVVAFDSKGHVDQGFGQSGVTIEEENLGFIRYISEIPDKGGFLLVGPRFLAKLDSAGGNLKFKRNTFKSARNK